MTEDIMPAQVLSFWFEDLTAKQHFAKDAKIDAVCRERFGDAIIRAAAGGLDPWQHQAEGSLALILLMDQFSRNAFRNTAQAFAYDAAAIRQARAMVRTGQDMAIPLERRSFVYMPYMHQEDLAAQEACIQLFTEKCPDEGSIRYAVIHRDIIARFGRFPHRNAILGRPSTDAELAFLESDGFKG